jgi:hypothetical protein
MIKRVVLMVTLALLFASERPVKAVTDVCIYPLGYIELCGALCGNGGCTAGYPGDYCIMTEDGYGCHDGYDDPCCKPEPSF